jgi:ankyrin repeat protein
MTILFYAFSDIHHTDHVSRFLWVRLQIDVLWDACTTGNHTNLTLSNLPKDLDETYERCLKRVEREHRRDSLRVLRYVCEAKPPLTIEALGEALAINSATGGLVYRSIPAPSDILHLGANLVIVDEVERLVIPAHHSVRKFLDSFKADTLKAMSFCDWYDLEPNLGEMCITHLIWHASGAGADTIQIRLPSIQQMSNSIKPLSRSSPRLMGPLSSKHKQNPPSSSRSQQEPLIFTSQATRTAALRLQGPFYNYARDNWISLSHELTTASATWRELERLVQVDLKDSQNHCKCGDPTMFPWKSDSPSPLSSKILGWALWNAHLPLLEIGLREHKDSTLPLDDYHGLLPLHLAAKLGRLDVFDKIYRSKNAWPLDICPKSGRTALHYAAEQGHAKIVDLLLSMDEVSNREAVQECDRESCTPLQLAISTGSLTTMQTMDSKCGSGLWKHDYTESLLHALSAGGSLPEIVSYVLDKMNDAPLFVRDARILTWVIKNNDDDLVASLVKAGVSLDIILKSEDKEQTWSPAIFFALEAPTPAMASAFIGNGADSNVKHYLNVQSGLDQDLKWDIICPIDLMLSRGWESLASNIYPFIWHYKSYDEIELELDAKSAEISWFSILTEGWVINEVDCRSHALCSQSYRQTHQRFLFANSQGNEKSHHLTISLVCIEAKKPNLQFKLMIGTKETAVSDWRLGPRNAALNRSSSSCAMTVCVGDVRHAIELVFNTNPYNIQFVRVCGDEIQCSSDMSS